MNAIRKRVHGRGDSRAGVTLIELLVVTSIIVVVIGVIASAVSAGIAVWDTARNYDAHRIEALIWLETLEMELRSSLSLHEIATECRETEILFPSLVRDEAIGTKGSICQIRYWFDSDVGRIRRQVRSFPFPIRSDENDMIMVSAVRDLKLTGTFAEEEEPEESNTDRLTSVTVELKLGEGEDRIEIRRTIHLPAQPQRDSEDADDEA